METLTGRTAVVTGGASGIGLEMARRFVDEGMRVAIADVEQVALDQVTAEFAESDNVLTIRADVSSAEDVEQLAAVVQERWGNVDVLCLNAGVMGIGGAWEHTLDDWRWVISVNLWGAVHGVHYFVPAMLAHGEESHVVFTSSMSGLAASGKIASYEVTKAAIIALAEGLAAETAQLPGARMGVTVLAPGGVRTNIQQFERNRPAGLANAAPRRPEVQAIIDRAADPRRTDIGTAAEIAECALEAIRQGTLYVLPMQPPYKDVVRGRLARIREALDRSADLGMTNVTSPKEHR